MTSHLIIMTLLLSEFTNSLAADFKLLTCKACDVTSPTLHPSKHSVLVYSHTQYNNF